MLLSYYEMAGLPENQRPSEFLEIASNFNASQKPNYSPTAFQVHAIAPFDEKIKTMDYVGTVAYLKAEQYLKVLKYAQLLSH